MTRLPSTPALPDYSTDSTGVLTGNTDIGTQTWTGRTEREEVPPLPGREHLIDAEFGPGFYASILQTVGTPVDPMATPIPKLPGRAGKEL